MILVTGGTGLVGSHLLFQLVKNKKPVRAIYRTEKRLALVKHLFSYYSENYSTLFDKIDWVKADITSIPKLKDAFEGVDEVYHSAALVSFEPQDFFRLKKINIEGTANVVNMALSTNIKKLCYVSSIAAIGGEMNPDVLITENSPWNNEEDNNVYAISKYGAEMEVWRAVHEGLDAVIVNPGLILGAGFWKGRSSGSLFTQIYKGMRYYTTGVSGYIDVWDVVNAMLKLMNSTITNERFILIAENLSFKNFQEKVAEQLKVPPPQREAKPWLLNIAWRIDWMRFKIFGGHRKLSKQLAKTAHSKSFYDNSKVKAAIGFEFKPINHSIKEVCELFLKDLEA